MSPRSLNASNVLLSHSSPFRSASQSDLSSSSSSPVAFPYFEHCSHPIMSVSIDFTSNSRGGCTVITVRIVIIAQLTTILLLTAVVFGIIRVMFQGRISLNLVLLQLLPNFVRGFWSELMYIPHIVNIRLSLIHLHGFKAACAASMLIEIVSLGMIFSISFKVVQINAMHISQDQLTHYMNTFLNKTNNWQC